MDQRLPDPAGAAPPDWRGLCEELVNELQGYASANPYHDSDALVARARAALAQPEPEVVGPTDDASLEAAAELIYSDAMEWAAKQQSPPGYINIPAWQQGGNSDAQDVARRTARAVLSRWGRPAPAPAEGEVEKAPAVTEVIAWLRTEAEIDDGFELTQSAAYQRRAAELLERQAGPVPVAVSERLPGPGDCDAEGRVWLYRPQTPILNPYWDLVKLDYIDPVPPTHWLPATALPLPQGEVKP